MGVWASADEAVARVRSGDRIYVGSNCGQPETLCEALVRRADSLRAVELVHLIVFGEAPYVRPGLEESFRHAALFVGANTRQAVREHRADYVPVFLSDVPRLFKNGQMPLDVALVSVSPPDAHGFCSLGVSVDIGMAACKRARTVIAEVNPHMPRTLGDSFLHLDEIDVLVAVDRPLPEHDPGAADETSRAIAAHIARLIEDGSTIQTGIGRLPNAILEAFADKNDLGIHTELFSDGLIAAIERGNVNCRRKTLHPNKVVASFCIGSQNLYRYIDNNPFFEFRPTEYVNDVAVIAQNERMVTINSALEVDLTGQVASDSIGHEIYSGVGGQVDFVRGAARSVGGKAIIALPSRAKGGTVSRIVATLRPGAGVVTSRADVHYVATEFGVAYLHGKTLRDRSLSLIRIAHPDFRDRLLDEAKGLGLVAQDQPSVDYPYPAHLSKTMTARNGTSLLLRAILPTDEQMLKGHFYALSGSSKRHRFSRAVETMPASAFRDWVNVDYRSHMALVAVQTDADEGERIIGVARYFANQTTGLAEFAMAVRDDWQGQGVGRCLLEGLVAAAREAKLVGLVGYVDADNAPMLRLLQSLDLPHRSSVSDGQVVYRVDLGTVRAEGA